MSRIPISHKNRIRGEERHRKRADLNLSANNAADLLALEETLTAVDVILADAIQTVSDDLDIVELAVIDIESDSAALTTRVDIAETDIDNNTTAITAEANTRATADTTLQNNINAEAATRLANDNALDGRINTTNSNLLTEITDRSNADTTLQTNITTEATTRGNADTALQNELNNTNTNVTNLDTRLTTAEGSLSTAQADITTLETDLANADIRLTDAIALVETDRTTIVPQIGGGALVALRENEIYDGGTYTLPLANSVLENQTIIITLPDEFRDFTPIVSVTGSDAIFYSGRSTTASVGGYSILFDAKKLQSITLTSDGSAVWGL